MSTPSKSSKEPRIRDLTGTRTVYSARLSTIRIKLSARRAAGEEIELLTIRCNAELEQVLDVIFATLDDDQEHFIILILNVANELIGYKVVASGSQEHVYVDPKLVFRNALLLGASNIILAHNHPGGQTTPSPHDISLTGELCICGRFLALGVLDHIIYTKKERLSMRQAHPSLFGDHTPA